MAEPFALTNSFVGTEEYLAPEACPWPSHSANVLLHFRFIQCDSTLEIRAQRAFRR